MWVRVLLSWMIWPLSLCIFSLSRERDRKKRQVSERKRTHFWNKNQHVCSSSESYNHGASHGSLAHGFLTINTTKHVCHRTFVFLLFFFVCFCFTLPEVVGIGRACVSFLLGNKRLQLWSLSGQNERRRAVEEARQGGMWGMQGRGAGSLQRAAPATETSTPPPTAAVNFRQALTKQQHNLASWS